MTIDTSRLTTESRNPKSVHLDQMEIPEILTLINQEDHTIAKAVQEQIPVIAKVIEEVVSRIRQGGRLFLCGAGTSGRLAAMEAAECPPTFSSPPELVQAIMAGAPESFFRAVEGAEDDRLAGEEAARLKKIIAKDFMIGISASGRTPYLEGALCYARNQGAGTALLCANFPKIKEVDFVIAPNTGPEILTGSTRMKAATAAKMILNMITTTTMVALGKVYGNWMVDLSPNSKKLVDRAIRIVMEVTQCSHERAAELIQEAKNAKVAIVMQLKNATKEEAWEMLEKAKGRLRTIISEGSVS